MEMSSQQTSEICEILFEILIFERHRHFYDYCKVYCSQLGGALDPFVVLKIVTAFALEVLDDNNNNLQYSQLHYAVKELLKNDVLKKAIEQGVNKLVEYITRLDERIRCEQGNYSSIIVKNVHSISFYRSSGSIMVFSDIGGGFVEDRVGCPLPSWVKGYLRLLLHKLVFTYALKEAIDSGRADLADLYTLYVYLLSRDDESIVVKVPRCEVNVVNLVGVLMGCGGLASFLKVYRVASEPGCCVYRFGVERERIPYVVALVQRLYGFLEKLGVKVGDVVEMLEYFDDVVAVLASWASTALDDRGYRFLPFTASYPRVHSQLPPQYVFSKTRASEASVRRYLGVLMGLLRSYALYLIDVVGRCRR